MAHQSGQEGVERFVVYSDLLQMQAKVQVYPLKCCSVNAKECYFSDEDLVVYQVKDLSEVRVCSYYCFSFVTIPCQYNIGYEILQS